MLRLQKGDQRLALDAQVWWQLCTWFSMPQDQEVKVIADCRQDVRWGSDNLAAVGALHATQAALYYKAMQPSARVPAWLLRHF